MTFKKQRIVFLGNYDRISSTDLVSFRLFFLPNHVWQLDISLQKKVSDTVSDMHRVDVNTYRSSAGYPHLSTWR